MENAVVMDGFNVEEREWPTSVGSTIPVEAAKQAGRNADGLMEAVVERMLDER